MPHGMYVTFWMQDTAWLAAMLSRMVSHGPGDVDDGRRHGHATRLARPSRRCVVGGQGAGLRLLDVGRDRATGRDREVERSAALRAAGLDLGVVDRVEVRERVVGRGRATHTGLQRQRAAALAQGDRLQRITHVGPVGARVHVGELGIGHVATGILDRVHEAGRIDQLAEDGAVGLAVGAGGVVARVRRNVDLGGDPAIAGVGGVDAGRLVGDVGRLVGDLPRVERRGVHPVGAVAIALVRRGVVAVVRALRGGFPGDERRAVGLDDLPTVSGVGRACCWRCTELRSPLSSSSRFPMWSFASRHSNPPWCSPGRRRLACCSPTG